MPAPTYPLPAPPNPNPSERVLPKKRSMSTLRSALTRKASTNTLHSMRSSAHLPSIGMTHTSEIPPLPRHQFPMQPRWPDTNLPTTQLNDAGHSDAFLPPVTPSKNSRTPKTSIGRPRIQPSTSPSTFLQDVPRRAPEMPKKQDSLTPLPSSDDAHPFPLPDLVHSPGSMTMDPSELGTPDSTFVASLQALVEAPIVHAARAESALKPKRLLSLPPRQHKDLHGFRTPSLVQKRVKKTTGDASALLNKGPAPSARTSNGLPTIDPSRYARLVEHHSRSWSGRDPLGIMLGSDTAQPVPWEGGDGMPVRSGARDGWCTPALCTENGENRGNHVNDYFGASKPETAAESTTDRTCSATVDFSASPVRDGLPKSTFASIDSEGLPSDIRELRLFSRMWSTTVGRDIFVTSFKRAEGEDTSKVEHGRAAETG